MPPEAKCDGIIAVSAPARAPAKIIGLAARSGRTMSAQGGSAYGHYRYAVDGSGRRDLAGRLRAEPAGARPTADAAGRVDAIRGRGTAHAAEPRTAAGRLRDGAGTASGPRSA